MQIKILGPGCRNCAKLEKATRTALDELGLTADVTTVSDYADIAAYGVMSTPGLVVDEAVLVFGRVPKVAELKEMLAPLG